MQAVEEFPFAQLEIGGASLRWMQAGEESPLKRFSGLWRGRLGRAVFMRLHDDAGGDRSLKWNEWKDA